VIDHLGIQMYQSPVAAVAEVIANAWDADAEAVRVQLPTRLDPEAEIVIADDGLGMTFEQCQERYLNVGYNRRGNNPAQTSSLKGRPVLGRKGIGKFAGFGIADAMEITTTSAETGERTTFALDINRLRGDTDEYVEDDPVEIDVPEYLPADESRRSERGTIIRLQRLKLRQTPSESVFLQSMARRFLLHQRADDFTVLVNGKHLPQAVPMAAVQFDFPSEYRDAERPQGLLLDDGWGIERLRTGREVRWRILFHRDPIAEEELTGISVFARGKLAQTPFFFHLTGGLGGQYGQTYMTGQVEADFLDELDVDLIATERQRIDWEHSETEALLEWGQQRVQNLLRRWQERRAEDKMQVLRQRVEPFADRLARLPGSERRVVERALVNMAKVPSINTNQFADLGESVITAWERGRLSDLLHTLAEAEELTEGELISILLEANVLTALQTAEAVLAKLEVVRGLQERIEKRDLENRLRDFIAENPWLIGPEWETFAKETRVSHVLEEASLTAGVDRDEDWKGRVDVVLSNRETLLVIEFMRPRVKIDWDHVNRYERYILEIQGMIRVNSGLGLRRVSGLLVADDLTRSASMAEKLEDLGRRDMLALDWHSLLAKAKDRWKDFLDVLVDRAPEDKRLSELPKQLRTAEGEGATSSSV
jgi:hypothetical protein